MLLITITHFVPSFKIAGLLCQTPNLLISSSSKPGSTGGYTFMCSTLVFHSKSPFNAYSPHHFKSCLFSGVCIIHHLPLYDHNNPVNLGWGIAFRHPVMLMAAWGFELSTPGVKTGTKTWFCNLFVLYRWKQPEWFSLCQTGKQRRAENNWISALCY